MKSKRSSEGEPEIIEPQVIHEHLLAPCAAVRLVNGAHVCYAMTLHFICDDATHLFGRLGIVMRPHFEALRRHFSSTA